MFIPGIKKFIINVGDEGTVLSLIESGKLTKKFFIQSPNSDECDEAKKFISENRNVPVYMLVDILDQSYTVQSIPPVSAFTARNLVKRKLERDFNPNDIKSAILQGRNDTGRKDWNYLFTSMPSVPPLSEWIDLVNELPNRFAGIYLLPLETESLVKDLYKVAKIAKPSRWKILVTYNKVGGIRQTVFRDFKFVMTRINQPVGGNDPAVIAGSVEQDLLNTIEFIRRVGFDEKDGLEVFIVVSEQVKQSLEQNKISARNIILLTPFEACEKLSLKGFTEKEDIYSDILYAAHFAYKTKKVHRLTTKLAEAQDRFSLYRQAMIISASTICFLLFVAAIYQIGSIISTSGGISKNIKDKKGLLTTLESIKKEAADLPINPEVIVSNIYYNNIFKQHEKALMNDFTVFSQIKDEGFEVKLATAKFSEKNKNQQTFIRTGERIGTSESPIVESAFNIDLVGKINGVEQIIENTQSMANIIKMAFPAHDVVFENMPDKTIINANLGSVQAGKQARVYYSFKVLLTGPKKELGTVVK